MFCTDDIWLYKRSKKELIRDEIWFYNEFEIQIEGKILVLVLWFSFWIQRQTNQTNEVESHDVSLLSESRAEHWTTITALTTIIACILNQYGLFLWEWQYTIPLRKEQLQTIEQSSLQRNEQAESIVEGPLNDSYHWITNWIKIESSIENKKQIMDHIWREIVQLLEITMNTKKGKKRNNPIDSIQ